MIRTIIKHWIPLVVSTFWIFFATAVVVLFNRYLLMRLPLGLRMVLMFINYWSIAAVPVFFALRERYLPFQKNKMALQGLWGLVIGVGLSLAVTFVPHLLGLGHLVGGDQKYSHLWQFIYQLLYYLAAVAAVEEFLFRGFLYHKLLLLFRKEWVAIVVSSILFGLFHFGSGDILQVLSTGAMGMLLCLCRKKLRHCTLLSLIIAHGLYDWLICLWAWVFG